MINKNSQFIVFLLTAFSFLPVLVVNAQTTPKPTKLQCVESLHLTVPQKEVLVQIKNEPLASRDEKIEQFIAELTPVQRQELKACLAVAQ